MKLSKEKNLVIELTQLELDRLKLLVQISKSIKSLPDDIAIFAMELEKTLDQDITTIEESYDLGNDYKIKIPTTNREELFKTYGNTFILKGELFDKKI